MGGPFTHRAGHTRRLAAGQAYAAMLQALRAGGTCSVEVGGRRRVLMHDPRVDRPASPLPWPLSLFQSATVRYVVFDDERRVSSHIYSRRHVGKAIAYFLRGVAPEQEVTIVTHEQPGR